MKITKMKRRFYKLTASACAKALMRSDIAKADAAAANAELCGKYSCSGLITSGTIGVGLVYNYPANIDGFSKPQQVGVGHWMVRPNEATEIGRLAKNRIDDCADLMELYTWSLEKCLGVFGMVASGDETHFVVTNKLKDGSVLISIPQGAWLARDIAGCELDTPVIPPEATEIDESQAKQLMGELLSQAYDGV